MWAEWVSPEASLLLADGHLLPGSSAGHPVHSGPGVSLCFKNTRQIALGPLKASM